MKLFADVKCIANKNIAPVSQKIDVGRIGAFTSLVIFGVGLKVLNTNMNKLRFTIFPS